MEKSKMMKLVDSICEENGYEDSPAYDLIFDECCDGRSDEDAKELIKSMLEGINK